MSISVTNRMSNEAKNSAESNEGGQVISFAASRMKDDEAMVLCMRENDLVLRRRCVLIM